MSTQCITEQEYNKLVQKLDFFETTRNTLLAFSFTSVLAALGVALGTDEKISAWIFLIPFFLIIPFTARIAYYRMAYAHMITFLKKFAPERTRFEYGVEYVPENHGCSTFPFHLMDWLINHEMLLLGVATDFIFIYKYIAQVEIWNNVAYLGLIVPALCTAIVYILSNAVYSFQKLRTNFKEKWDEYESTL